MPLSDHEQRLLDQIEQALYDEDPKFARLYRSSDVRTHYRHRVVRGVIGLVIGLGLLLAGVILAQTALGVAGFVVMLAGVSYAVASWQRMTGHRASAPRDPAPRRRRPHRDLAERGPKPPHRSLVQRLEDRWQRRQDEAGGWRDSD